MTQVARGLWGLDTLHGLYLARDAAAESKYLPKLTTILKKKTNSLSGKTQLRLILTGVEGKLVAGAVQLCPAGQKMLRPGACQEVVFHKHQPQKKIIPRSPDKF